MKEREEFYIFVLSGAHVSCYLNKGSYVFILHWALQVTEPAAGVEVGEVSHKNMGTFT